MRFTQLKELAKLSLPIFIGQLSQMLIVAGDIFVAGKYSTDVLAAVGIANGIINILFIIGCGLILGCSPILSTKRGSGNNSSIYMYSTLFYSLTISVLFLILIRLALLLLPVLTYSVSMKELIFNYTCYSSWSYVGVYVFLGMKDFLYAHEDIHFSNILVFVAILLNLFLNFVFVFGLGGFNEYGIVGLAISSIITQTCAALSIVIYGHIRYPSKLIIHWDYLRKVFNLSWPVSLNLLLEVLAFSTISIVVGEMNTIQAAANSIIVVWALIFFKLPQSISFATTIKISHAFGEKNWLKLIGYTKASLALTGVSTISIAVACFLFKNDLLLLFSRDKDVVSVGIDIMIVIAVFQLFDGYQVVLASILKSIGITKPIPIISFVGYWIVGIPLGLFLAIEQNLMAIGMWVGLAIAFVLTMCCSIVILKRYLKKVHISFLEFLPCNRSESVVASEFEDIPCKAAKSGAI